MCRDADLDRAAQGIVWGAFLNAGQTCASVERVYVEEEVAEPFMAEVVEETRKLRLGDPAQAGVDVGPMTLERQRRIVSDHVDDARARGAQRPDRRGDPRGARLLLPAHRAHRASDHSMRIMREETFGPVLPIMVVDSLDEAMRLANDSEYGLTASGWTSDPQTAARLQRELQAGVVTINDCVSSFGEPTRALGRLSRRAASAAPTASPGLREMVQVKYVTRDSSRGPRPGGSPTAPSTRA